MSDSKTLSDSVDRPENADDMNLPGVDQAIERVLTLPKKMPEWLEWSELYATITREQEKILLCGRTKSSNRGRDVQAEVSKPALTIGTYRRDARVTCKVHFADSP